MWLDVHLKIFNTPTTLNNERSKHRVWINKVLMRVGSSGTIFKCSTYLLVIFMIVAIHYNLVHSWSHDTPLHENNRACFWLINCVLLLTSYHSLAWHVVNFEILMLHDLTLHIRNFACWVLHGILFDVAFFIQLYSSYASFNFLKLNL